MKKYLVLLVFFLFGQTSLADFYVKIAFFSKPTGPVTLIPGDGLTIEYSRPNYDLVSSLSKNLNFTLSGNKQLKLDNVGGNSQELKGNILAIPYPQRNQSVRVRFVNAGDINLTVSIPSIKGGNVSIYASGIGEAEERSDHWEDPEPTIEAPPQSSDNLHPPDSHTSPQITVSDPEQGQKTDNPFADFNQQTDLNAGSGVPASIEPETTETETTLGSRQDTSNPEEEDVSTQLAEASLERQISQEPPLATKPIEEGIETKGQDDDGDGWVFKFDEDVIPAENPGSPEWEEIDLDQDPAPDPKKT